MPPTTEAQGLLGQLVAHRAAARDESGRKVIDAAALLAWSSARGSGDLGPGNDSGTWTAPDVVAVLTRAHQRYRSPILAPPSPASLAPPLCSAVSDLWRADLAPSWRALPIETFGELHEQHGAMPHRKSTGVYYTPAHVVRSIIENAFTALAEQLGPAEMGDLRVLDPACGCGSFLLGAYRRLLASAKAFAGHDRLTSLDRLEILARHIYGIDLDGEAIAIAELSLVFEALYADLALDAEATAAAPLERAALASLHQHLVCGNALVSPDFAPVDASELADVRPLDVERAFPAAFAAGGFDLVVGNPPYVSYGGRHAVPLSSDLRSYFARRYGAAGWMTAHSMFMERAITSLSRRAVSFIVPDQVGHLAGYAGLRALLLEHAHLREVRYWGEDVFAGVTTPSLTFLLQKGGGKRAPTTITDSDGACHQRTIRQGAPWVAARSMDLLDKLRERSSSLRPYLADCGIRTTHAKSQVIALTDALPEDLPALEGKQIGRYRCEAPRIAIRATGGKAVYMRKGAQYERAAFLIRQTAAYPIVGPRQHATFFRNSLLALYAPPEGGPDVRYLVALLNSKLMRFAYAATVQEAEQRVFPQVKLGALGQLPIRQVDLADASDRRVHDALVHCVAAMLELQGAASRGPNDGEAAAAIDALDQRIDALVYAAYGLEDVEIAAVEAAVGKLRPPP